MPIGYLITTAGIASCALSAVARHRPRTSRPFRLSYVFGIWLNWPSVAFAFLLASSALALTETGGATGFWIGFGLAVMASGALAVLRRRAKATGPVVERALDEGLESGWRQRAGDELTARLRRRPSLLGVLLAPVRFRRAGIERISNIRYGPARRGNLLDVYRDRSDGASRPTLVYLHPGAFRLGSKRLAARHMLYRLASHGWVCVSANYRLEPTGSFPDPVIDVKKVIAWVREHGREYGADPAAVYLAGSSAGGHLASLAALTPNDPVFQPGFEEAETAVAGAISLYGYYGPVGSNDPPSSPRDRTTATAPPWLLVHGEQDTLVVVDDARAFAEQLRASSSNPVVYAELPGAQHGFDLFRSRRLETVIDAIEVFAACAGPSRPSGSGDVRAVGGAALQRR